MSSAAENTSKKTTKVTIPHTVEQGTTITGVLEQVAPEEPSQGRRIALVLHGAMGHKDYLFQKRLAQRLPIDSFRFDFRGNHETPGIWKYGHFLDDVADLEIVVAYLQKEYGYVIDMLVGHSRGSVVSLLWICKHRDGDAKTVRRYVNVSGRYRMTKVYDDMNANKEQLERQGFIERRATVARKPFVARITKEDYDSFASVDTSIAWTQFPASIDVLTLHGLRDAVVPPYDAFIFGRIYGARSPGTHTLRYVEEADHNFTGMPDEVNDTILEWMAQQERNELTTGLWHTGLRNKL
ncbi:ectomycorrhiza-regulated esterase [Dichomitus squalens]|uniref:ectomycorrhiza-regulated esterase n=1 Tax=Dichomitus squalens (strain LYAD-421) TaxID=732165 RepID=UPI0004413BD9|nr:ectomycorrhiza-regulated esterase [Dichomitus squalens LYAD-421 SS1]EJF63394.1 ectomycorrhiza-regulated esterase [Dichomitus squalens LYAD-421 SS1]TBU47767.1 ectomycorrhiza-regulated esterase [Dichomitus squalens]